MSEGAWRQPKREPRNSKLDSESPHHPVRPHLCITQRRLESLCGKAFLPPCNFMMCMIQKGLSQHEKGLLTWLPVILRFATEEWTIQNIHNRAGKPVWDVPADA